MRNSQASYAKGRIAVLDDDVRWRSAVATFLEKQGFKVETFTNTSEFLTAVESFDVALVDYLLPQIQDQPKLYGSDVITFVKTLMDVPPAMILISAYFLDDIKLLAPGAEAYLNKTIGFAAILHQIEQTLSKQVRS
jgi:DNA-binding response OmpR family regulator